MTAKEFYEKNRGLYFRYNGETVRVVGYHPARNGLMITCSDGWSNCFNEEDDFYLDNTLVNRTDRYMFISINELYEANPLNLCELLAGHEGETFYSTIYGDVIITKISDGVVYFKTCDNRKDEVAFDGRHDEEYPGECTLFPSKENRDWSTYKPKVVLPENSVVMVADKERFRLRFYKSENQCYAGGFDGHHWLQACTWKYIVPIADYDMNATFEENCKKSII